MNLLNIPFLTDLVAIRRDIHSNPELAFNETRTSDIVSNELVSYRLEVHRGLAKTGVVGVLRKGGSRSIGLRADMDALPLQEKTNFGIAQKLQERCMPVVMTGIQRYYLAPRVIWGKTKRPWIFEEQFILSFNRPKNPRVGPR